MENNSNTSSRTPKKQTEDRPDQNERAESTKSLSAIIGQSLAQESQEGVERVFSQVNEYLTQTKEYINENPKEAAALAVSLGIAAWAFTATKPGRRAFEIGAAFAVPQLSKWFTSNFSGMKH